MRRLVLATNNTHKVREIREILGGMPIEVVDASSLDNPPDPEENGATIEENAVIKARAFHEATGEWTLADDSGLEIDALDGAPGVISARFAGPGCTFDDNNKKVLELMSDVADASRTARFRCVAALVTGSDEVKLFEGTVEGTITRSVVGEEGFGYDPIFFSDELGCTFAEAPPSEKNRISHRGLAFRSAGERIKQLVAGGRGD